MSNQMFNPARAVSIAVLFMVALLLCPAGGRAQTTTANVSLAISTSQVHTTAIPSDFSGLSFEMGSVIYDDVNDGWYLSGSNGAMIALANTLGVKSIRVGGNSAETGNIATAADEDAVLDYCHAIGANLIWDLEIDGTLYDPSNSPTDPYGKPVIAQSMQNYANSKGYLTNTNSLVFQVGNEPDLMPNMTDSIYDTDFSNYIQNTNALYSGSRWAGPDTSAGGTFYSPVFCPAEGPSGQVAFVCQHLYPFGSSLTAGSIATQMATMLASSVDSGYQSFMTQWVPYATAAGLAPRYEECNSYFHNGSFGSSNAYASALWGLDWMYYHAQAGLAGINFHTGLNSNDPAYSFATPANVATSYTIHPLAYAILAFNMGGHGRIVPVTIGNPSSINLVAYSVLQSDGSLVITAINRTYGSPDYNAALSISTSGTTYNDAQVMFLTGSNNDPTTTTGVMLGGSAISGQGVWIGAYLGMRAPSGGAFTLTLPATQAAIIRLFTANGPAAPASLSATAGNTQATLNWNVSTSATSYVIERASVTGGPYTTIASGVTTNSYTDTSVANGLTYYYVVAAMNSNGVGPQSMEANTTLPQDPPVSPSGITGTPGDSVVSLSWNAVAGATNYILESSTSSGGPYAFLASTPNPGYLVSGLTDGITYYFTISAVGPYGQGQASAGIGETPFVNPGIGWINTVTSSAQSWNVNSNWSSGYPNTAQSVAVVNSAIAAAQTIDVNQAITVGELQIGASSGGGSFILAGNGGTLTFQNSPAPGSVLQLASSKGDTISAPLVVTGNLIVSNSSANPLTLSGNFSGTNNIAFNGGTVVLGGATTYSGTATVVGGTLQLANSLALQDAIFNPTGGTVAFNGITSATLGALIGTLNVKLVNTASSPVTLTVGNDSFDTTYAGALTGSGSLTVAGSGALTLTGTSNYTGTTTVSGGSLIIASGTFGSSTGTIIVGNGAEGVSFNVTGGMATAGTIQIAPDGGSTGDYAAITGSGSAAFANVNIGSGSNTSGGITINTTGAVSLGILTNVRDTGAGAGLAVQGGVVTATSVDIQANSDKVANMDISGGSTTIGTSSSTNAFKVGDAGDGGFLTVSGGALTYLGTDGLQLTTAAAIGSAILTSGTTILTGITLNSGGSTTATSTLSLQSGAALYLGSVGLVAKLPDPNVSISFGTATLGAIAAFSSSAPITLIGILTIQAADSSGVAHNITYSGALSGTGGLIKTGAGQLTLSASSSYSAATTVSAGTLLLSGTLVSGGGVTVANAATLNLAYGTLTSGTATVNAGSELIDCGTINGSLVNKGTVISNCGGAVTVSGSVTNSGTMMITNDTTMQVGGTFTNNGLLDIMTGGPVLPAKFVNNGTVLNSSLVKVNSVAETSSTLTISIQTYPGHTYQLQSEASLANPAWTNVTNNVTSQTNGNGVMTFSLTNVPGTSQFYRIQVGP
jgi:autotransporter-associated beta strand protein